MKKAQTTHAVKKSTTEKTSTMHKSDNSVLKSKKQVASAKHHRVHRMAKIHKTIEKSHKSSTKTSKTSTKSKNQSKTE